MATPITPAAALERNGTTVRATVARIMAHWALASDTVRAEGAAWYPCAGQAVATLAAQHGMPAETVAAVVAHLSPRTPWQRNKDGAASVLAGAPIPGLLSQNLRGARRALESDAPLATLNGPKVRAFARNILGDGTAVTVDVWATRVALGDRADADLVLQRVGVYDAIAHCYRLAARRAGVAPSTMQAATWIVARGGRKD